MPITGPDPQRGMIFQEANLLPWLSAVDNVAFPLKLRRVPKAERLAAAARMLELTGLAGFERLLDDAELRRRMGQAGRERIREHFTWPAVTDLTIQAYEDALAG